MEDATSRTIYVDEEDGVEETTSVVIGGTYDRTTVGRGGDSTPDEYTNGALDNIWIYAGGTALTAAQVRWLMTGGLGGSPATYYDVVNSPDPDNPGTTDLAAWFEVRQSDLFKQNTIHDVHGSFNLVTQGTGTSGPIAVIGFVPELTA